MRLRNIKMKEEANKYLGHYLPIHNNRFTVEPKKTFDFHFWVLDSIELDAILHAHQGRAEN